MFDIKEFQFDKSKKPKDWIYPLPSTKDLYKKFFVWGDLSFKDSIAIGSRALVNENSVATVFLERTNPKSAYDYVPLYPSVLPKTENQKYLLYCLGSSNQKTAEGINQMVTKTFDMLNKAVPELTTRNFQLWIVANPGAYQPNRAVNLDLETYKYTAKESVMFNHLDKLNESVNVIDWFGAIVENTTVNFMSVSFYSTLLLIVKSFKIQYAKFDYYDFQKLILYYIMQKITGISVLKSTVVMNIIIPCIKDSFFMKRSSEVQNVVSLIIAECTDSIQTDFKSFYSLMRKAFEIEYNDNKKSLPYCSALTADGTLAATIDAKTYNSGHFGKIWIQGTYKRLNLKVAIKVLDARQFNGEVGTLKKKLTGIDNDYIMIVRDIATDENNFNIFYIATEFCKNGNLLSYISRQRPKKSFFVRWIKNMAAALIYLHGNNIVHCDMKLANVILDSHFNAKICDIDSIQWLNGSEPCMLQDAQYTKCYAAPEFMNDKLCDSRVDVWAYCIIVLELIVKKLKPEFCQDLRNDKQKSLDEVLTSVPESVQNLIRAGLIVERTERYFMKDMMPLINEIEIEFSKMQEVAWNACAKEDSLKNYVQPLPRIQINAV